MTSSRMKVVPRRKPEKPSPPVLSNDWIIQNHGDIGKGLSKANNYKIQYL